VALQRLQLPRPPAGRGGDPQHGQPGAVRQLQADPLPRKRAASLLRPDRR
jgi:hypothetical protein